MNILFITSWYPSKLKPTLGNFVERHALALKSKGHKVLVLHQAFSNKVLLPQLQSEIVNGLEVIHMFIPRYFKDTAFIKNKLAKKALKKISSMGFMPEVVHGHIIVPVGSTAVYISRLLKLPLVFTEHWSEFSDYPAIQVSPEILREAQSAAKSIEKIMPVSDSLGNSMQKMGITGNYTTVYNSVDESLFHYAPDEKHKRFTFLHISHLDSIIKNIDGIINSFAEFSRKTGYTADLIIAGDGDIEKIKAYTVSNFPDLKNIKYRGALSYSEVAGLMRSVHCFVLFSNKENLPCVIAEAHSCGVPVIGTTVGGIPEMINKENGILIAPKNEKGLYEAMLELFESFSFYNPRQIETNAHKNYAYTEISRKFEAVYREVLEEGTLKNI